MNILKPELIWVDGRCYRCLGNSESDVHNISPYVEDNLYRDDDYEEEYNCTDIEIVPYGATRFKHTFHVAKSFFPFIIGSKNTFRKKLETETKTTINVPKIGQDGDIVIIGFDRKGILIARHRINLLITGTRKRIRCTHFLSIPLNESSTIITNFNTFKNDVLTNSGKTSRGVDEMIFQTPSKLHLTIGVLTLLDDAERDQAIQALDYCKEHIIKPIIKKYGQIHVQLRETEIMNDDPTEATVLYAKVIDANDALQEMADKIVNYYAYIGLLQTKCERVKLHVTLINTKFKVKDEEVNNKDIKYPTFDAQEILKVHKDTFFGEITLNQIHLSQRHTISSNGYYQATAKINLSEVD